MGLVFVLLLVGLAAVGMFGGAPLSRAEPASRPRQEMTEAEAIDGLKAQYVNGDIDLAEFETRAERIYADGTGEMASIESLAEESRPSRSTEQNTQSTKSERRPQGSKRRGPGCMR